MNSKGKIALAIATAISIPIYLYGVSHPDRGTHRDTYVTPTESVPSTTVLTDGMTLPLCSLTLSDGSVIGSDDVLCADPSPRNGIMVQGETLQSCLVPTEYTSLYCFLYEPVEGNIIYTISFR